MLGLVGGWPGLGGLGCALLGWLLVGLGLRRVSDTGLGKAGLFDESLLGVGGLGKSQIGQVAGFGKPNGQRPRPLLTNEIKQSVDCAHLSHAEVAPSRRIAPERGKSQWDRLAGLHEQGRMPAGF